MKQLKHKRTGKIVRPFQIKGKTYYVVFESLKSLSVEFIPDWVIEGSSEWEETEIPTCPGCGRELHYPGGFHIEITAFRDKVNGVVIPRIKPDYFAKITADGGGYNGNAKSFLNAQEDRYEIYSVFRHCDKTKFAIGDEVLGIHDLDKIAGFRYENEQCYFALHSNPAEKLNCLEPDIKKIVVLRMKPGQFPLEFLSEIFGGAGIFNMR